MARSKQWLWRLWQNQSNGSGAYGKIKSMVLALMAKSHLWLWPLWQDQSNGSGP